MSLRKKLFLTFAGLGLMTLLVAAVTVWAMVQWNATEEELRNHYQRSLILEDVRAQASQAFLEVPEGLTGNDPDARQDFQETLQPAEADFQRWINLADSEEERQEVEQVRAAYNEAVNGSRQAFDLIEEERFDEGEALFDELEDTVYEEFQTVAQRVAEADQERREEIRQSVEETRRTAQIMLAIASFGALSLMMLLAAYLASDLFSPLKEVRDAIRKVRQGDREVRLSEERSDEIGEINAEFNGMVAAIAARERQSGMQNYGANGTRASDSESSNDADESPEAATWVETPTRVTLHRMISRMRLDVEGLEEADGASPERRRELVADLEELARAVSRITEFSYPLDLNFTSTNIRETIYGVVQRFNTELIERSVSLEVDISPEVHRAIVDRLKLREALSELVSNALGALPNRGGKIGLRSRLSAGDEGEILLIEVADDGVGARQSLIDQAFERDLEDEYSGISLVRAIIEQHGGEFSVESEPGEGTYARIEIPVRD